MSLRPLVLVLEDEPLIAMDIERNLLDAGVGEVVCMSSCASALSWLQMRTPEVAVLDIFLHDGECIEAAEILAERRVPFIVHSARRKIYSPHQLVFQSGAWLSKPCHPAELVEAVKSNLPKSRQLA